ncbi:hypothetical protein HYW21_02985 [Candidatus Woesearchaeota archaeon]|nr:hypothetical protein [Candidatus Woesearchaeota archaeon]
MGERLIQQNVNTVLLFVLLLIIGGIALQTIHFQTKLAEMAGQVEEKSLAYNNVSEELVVYKDKYNQTLASLQTSLKDLGYYDKLYVNKSSELETTKEGLMVEISTLNADIEQKKKELNDSSVVLRQTNDALISAQESNKLLQDNITTITTSLNDLQGLYDELKKDFDALDENCNQ